MEPHRLHRRSERGIPPRLGQRKAGGASRAERRHGRDGDLPRLTAQGKEEFSALLDAKIAAIRPGPYGVELVLDGVNSQLLAQYDETLANSSRAEHAMELFL